MYDSRKRCDGMLNMLWKKVRVDVHSPSKLLPQSFRLRRADYLLHAYILRQNEDLDAGKRLGCHKYLLIKSEGIGHDCDCV